LCIPKSEKVVIYDIEANLKQGVLYEKHTKTVRLYHPGGDNRILNGFLRRRQRRYPPPPPPGSSSGGLTFSDGKPSGHFLVHPVSNTTGTEYLQLGIALQSSPIGNSANASGNTVPIYYYAPTPGNYVVWSGSGTYMVIVNYSNDDFGYIKDVSFTNGNATIKRADLTIVQYPY
jgi:hypothetical protein